MSRQAERQELLAGDVDALVERLRRHVAEHDGGNGLLTHIEAGDFTQAADGLTSLRAELDEARAARDEADVPALRKVLWTSEVQQARSALDALKSCALGSGDDEGARSYANCIRRVLAETLRREPAAEARALKAEAENKALRQALEPFAKIVPSSFYAADGSEGEGYRIYLEAQPQHIAFTGSDIAKAREASQSQPVLASNGHTEAEPSGAVGAALAMVDAAEAVCPINSGRSNAEHCPKCGATSSQNCGPVATAHDALANAVRAAFKIAQPLPAEGTDAATSARDEP